MTKDSWLTRVTTTKYVDLANSIASANPDSIATVADFYSGGSMIFEPFYASWTNDTSLSNCPFKCSHIPAYKLGPSLNVMYCSKGLLNTYTPPRKKEGETTTAIKIAIKVSDIFKQSGELYPDESSLNGQPCFIATVPEGQIACKILSDESEEKQLCQPHSS